MQTVAEIFFKHHGRTVRRANIDGKTLFYGFAIDGGMPGVWHFFDIRDMESFDEGAYLALHDSRNSLAQQRLIWKVYMREALRRAIEAGAIPPAAPAGPGFTPNQLRRARTAARDMLKRAGHDPRLGVAITLEDRRGHRNALAVQWHWAHEDPPGGLVEIVWHQPRDAYEALVRQTSEIRRRAAERIEPKVEQKPCNIGLFDDDARAQTDLEDFTR